MLYHTEDRNIYLAVGLITAFLVFMFISGAISMHYSKNSSATLQEKRAQ